MLRIKRAVQASYNTELSFIAAQTASAKKGVPGDKPVDVAAAAARDAADPMAAMERQMGDQDTTDAPVTAKRMAAGGTSFVKSSLAKQNANGIDEPEESAADAPAVQNPDAIDIEDDDL